jgi:membrane protein implicated in regulation of membrane protease activity
MTTLDLLYQQAPFWIWLGVAAMFVSLSFATGANLLLLPAASAVLVALATLAGLRLGLEAETGVFAALSALALAAAFVLRPRAKVAMAGGGRPPRTPGETGERGPPQDPGALVGRIARATGGFANGVGRVWIDGSEWAAEIDGVEETLPPGASVRVIRVVGGVKLQVRGLEA